MSEHQDQIDREAAYIGGLVRKGLASDYEEPVDGQRVVGFTTVIIWNQEDEDGNTHETYSVYSDSKSNFIKLGMLEAGRQRLQDYYERDD